MEKDLKEKLHGKQHTMLTEKNDQIATLNHDITETQATLHDDQAYIKDLTTKCNERSKTWDERSSMRTNELSALTNCIDIISKRVKGSVDPKKVRRFLQISARVRNTTDLTATDDDMDSDGEEEDDVTDEAVADDSAEDNTDEADDTDGADDAAEEDDGDDSDDEGTSDTSFLQLTPRKKIGLLNKNGRDSH